MEYNWHIAGHKKQQQFLSKSLDSNALSHAYVFAGPDSVGKKAFASNFARILLCQNQIACGECSQCKSFKTGANPDYIQIAQEETIKIEQVRQLIYKLSLKPYLAKYKITVIDNADDMTVEAANALLKSMEEPKDYTIIILVTSNHYKLLPTILSRVQKINFGLVNESEYSHLLPQTLSPKDLEVIARTASGRPGLAIKIASDPLEVEQVLQAEQGYENFMNADLVDRLKLAADLAEAETPVIKNTLQFWLANLEKKLLTTPELQIAHRLNIVSEAKSHLQANANAKLLLTQMMISC